MPTIFTIGHSNQSADDFVALLKQNGIECLVDVRSDPYSRFVKHFNREVLRTRLSRESIDYLYFGDELGGFPDRSDLYVSDHVVYERVAALPEFRRGIRRLIEESEQRCTAIMCAEEDPAECHRQPLLARTLLERGMVVLHLRRNGQVQEAAHFGDSADLQLPLFEPPGEDLTWRSPKPSRRRKTT